jgi:septum formation protein
MSAPVLILASGSSSRRAMLIAAGVRFTVVLPGVDEEQLRETLTRKGADGAEIAQALAEAKTAAVARQHKEALVLGADQVLVCAGQLFSKATDWNSARATLQRLRGKSHTLISGVALAKNGTLVWRHRDSATLYMRDFSDAFLDAYLLAEIPDIFGSVGCYRIEGRGAQLFERIEGDQFCIRGLPLIAVLAALREQEALPS